MKDSISIKTGSYLKLLLMVSAICSLGFTGCSSLNSGTGTGSHAALIRKTDPPPDEDDDPVAANRNWYQMFE